MFKNGGRSGKVCKRFLGLRFMLRLVSNRRYCQLNLLEMTRHSNKSITGEKEKMKQVIVALAEAGVDDEMIGFREGLIFVRTLFDSLPCFQYTIINFVVVTCYPHHTVLVSFLSIAQSGDA